MTRRLATIAALLLALGVIALGTVVLLDRDVLQLPGADSLPSLSVPGRVDLGSSGSGSTDGDAPAPDPAPELEAGGPGRGDEDGDLDGRTVRIGSAEPAVTRLDPALLAALQAAVRVAAGDGIEVRVRSGWRSAAYQQELLDEAVVRYGSLEEASRWVASPDTSAHVTGDAVDVSATDAAYWMAEHGPEFGLCQSYANEIWHYELRTTPGGTCPPPLPDSAS